LDENGEKVHAAMYNDLWTNGPFEINEFPDYTLLDHFKRPYPSHPPRAVCLDYMEGNIMVWQRSFSN
jgi:trimethylamine monooxygenase